MTRSWLAIALCAGLAAGALSLLLARPRTASAPGEGAAPAESVSIALDVRADEVHATRLAVELGNAVRVAATNHDTVPVRLTLAGYEDRLDIGVLAPGSTWRGAFLADRPGEDFAWLVDGRPAGRFAVTGSHLVEGHR